MEEPGLNASTRGHPANCKPHKTTVHLSKWFHLLEMVLFISFSDPSMSIETLSLFKILF